MSTLQEIKQEYPIVLQIPVAWGEMDSFGHVNNCVYLKYFECARIGYFVESNFMKTMQETSIGPILASTECRFKRAVKYPDTIWSAAKVSSIREYDFDMQYLVYSEQQQAITTLGSGRIVMFDYKKNQKTPIPEKIIQFIETLEKNTLTAE